MSSRNFFQFFAGSLTLEQFLPKFNALCFTDFHNHTSIGRAHLGESVEVIHNRFGRTPGIEVPLKPLKETLFPASKGNEQWAIRH